MGGGIGKREMLTTRLGLTGINQGSWYLAVDVEMPLFLAVEVHCIF